jgi:hypothetical protein
MNHKFSLYMVFLTGALLILAGCSVFNAADDAADESVSDVPVVTVVADESLSDDNTSNAATTPEAASDGQEITVTEEPAATDEPAPADSAEIAATEDPAATTATEEATADAAATEESALPAVNLENPLPSRSPDGAYFVTPTYISLANTAPVEDAPAGHRWLLATVTLGNNTGPAVTVGEGDIYLIGSDGVRYAPSPMRENIRPALVGHELPADYSVYGFALFSVPETVEPRLFEWCAGECAGQPLQAPISMQD